jgi:DNA-binding CsgD family transcriptional regulator
MIKKVAFIQNKQEKSLKRKLFAYMLLLAAVILLALMCGMLLLGQLGNTKKDISQTLEMQMEVFSKDMEVYWENIAAMNISLSDNTYASIEEFLQQQELDFNELNDNKTALSLLQEELLNSLCSYLKQSDCSGAFVVLNATVNTSLNGAENSRSGIYIEKNSVIPDSFLLYRGIAEVGKAHNVMPHRKWRLEFDSEAFPDYKTQTAENATGSSSNYRISEMTNLPGTSEKAVFMSVPLVGKNEDIYGICGFEVTASSFKEEHAQPSVLKHMICMITSSEDELNADAALSTGIRNGYYLAPSGKLSFADFGSGLFMISDSTQSYVGVKKMIKLTEVNPEYTMTVMIPKADYTALALRSKLQISVMILLMMFFVAVCSFYFSNKFLSPIIKAMEQIKNNERENIHSAIQEINDLCEFLAKKDKENENTLQGLKKELSQNENELNYLKEEYKAAQKKYDAVKAEVARLSQYEKNEIDQSEYEHFLNCIKLLTAKEKEIFDLYIQGNSSKEILKLENISENTLKYHNRNIYSKLGVSSRKQLLLYASMMKESEQA